jgi:hypothetical protein
MSVDFALLTRHALLCRSASIVALPVERPMKPALQQLLDDARQVSGSPVQVIYDGKLPISARLQFARHGASHHLLAVHPGPAADYFIANQLGFLTRLYALQAGERFDFIIKPEARQAAAALVDELLLPKISLDDAGRGEITHKIQQWLMANVRSTPVGMRIDQMIFRDAPSLRESLLAGIQEQNDLNLAGLRSLQHTFKVPARLAGPAAAYAIFVDRLLGGTGYSIPFEAMGLIDVGRALLRDFDSVPPDPSSDRQLIDAWARQLGLSDWYRWAPFSA